MTEEFKPDEEDTISVPIVTTGAEIEVKEPDVTESVFDPSDVLSALESVSRVIATLNMEFERLRMLIEGEEGATTHAPPLSAMGLTPCCGKSLLDIPITERILFDGAGVTCKGVN